MECPFNKCYFSEKASVFRGAEASLDAANKQSRHLQEVLRVLVHEITLLKSIPDSLVYLLQKNAKELELTDEFLQNLTSRDSANSCLPAENPG